MPPAGCGGDGGREAMGVRVREEGANPIFLMRGVYANIWIAIINRDPN
jgi:hypothetical protein